MATPVDEYELRSQESLRYALGELVLRSLEDDDVVEIMLNDDSSLWQERFGSMRNIGQMSYADGMAILTQVAAALDFELTKETPIVEGELPLDGSRFEGVAPPVTVAPIFAIRKRPKRVYPLDEYVRHKIMSFTQAEVLRAAITDQQNILVVGGTGTGKTTFLNALLNEMKLLVPDVRMLLLEDTRELQCELANRVFLRATPWTGMELLAGAVNRLRPDRVTVGEVRFGAPTLALLKLWNTGHPGGLATVHANSAYGGLTRLDQLIQEVSANPQRVLIGEAVNYAVFLKRTPEGRRVKEIIKVHGYDHEKQEFEVEVVK